MTRKREPAPATVELVGDGVTDNAPIVQALYTAGRGKVSLKRGGTYYFNTRFTGR